MQTFLPYPDFEQSARSLDTKRLGKQRVECIQVVRGLTVPGYGWRHHPAVKMWRGCEEALARYAVTCCDVWTEMGYGDTCAATIMADLAHVGVILTKGSLVFTDPDGKTETVAMEAGSVGFRAADARHQVANPGPGPMRVIEVELK